MQKMVQVAGTETWGDDTTKQNPQAAETDLLIAEPGKMGRAHNSMNYFFMKEILSGVYLQ